MNKNDFFIAQSLSVTKLKHVPAIRLKYFSALILNLLKDIFERAQEESFNKFRMSAESVNISDRLNDFCCKNTILTLFFVALPAVGAQQPVSIQLRHDTPTELVSAEVAKKLYQDSNYTVGSMVRMIPVSIVREQELILTGTLPHSFFSQQPQTLRFKKNDNWVESEFAMSNDIIEQILDKISCEQLIEKALIQSFFAKSGIKELQDSLKELQNQVKTNDASGKAPNNWLIEQLIRAITPITAALTIAYIVHKDAVTECIPVVLIMTIGATIAYIVHCDTKRSSAFWKR